MKDLSFRAPPSLAIAENASSPAPSLPGIEIWSTTAGKKLVWDGSSWVAAYGSGGGGGSGGDVFGPASSIAGNAVDFADISGKLLSDAGGKPITAISWVLQTNQTLSTGASLDLTSLTLAPNETLILKANVICLTSTTTTGFGIGFYAPNTANGNLIGSGFTMVGIDTAGNPAATALANGFAFNTTGNINTTVLGTSASMAYSPSLALLIAKNTGTVNRQINLMFSTEVASSPIAAMSGSWMTGFKF